MAMAISKVNSNNNNKKTITMIKLILAILMAFISTFANAQLRGSGKTITKTYDYQNFDKLSFQDLDGSIEVEVGKEYSISVTIDDNLFPLLSFEEITQLAKVFVQNGVEKIRLTGGEPLLRKNIEILIESLAQLKTPEGKVVDITLTTNGVLLGKKAASLKAAGLNRVTVSLDALDDAIFKRMNDVDFPVQAVLDSIAIAKEVGLGSEVNGTPYKGLKVNMVVKKGVNDDQIIPMARHFRHSGIALRFIEFMDVGATNGWRMDDVLPSQQIIELLDQEFGLMQLPATVTGETAERYGYKNADGTHDKVAGEIGLISSVSKAFCKDCNRARISTEGKLYLCLFASQGYDLRQILRNPAINNDAEKEFTLARTISQIWHQRTDHYSELRALGIAPSNNGKRVEMSYIGG